jgi:hypothetical protein
MSTTVKGGIEGLTRLQYAGGDVQECRHEGTSAKVPNLIDRGDRAAVGVVRVNAYGIRSAYVHTGVTEVMAGFVFMDEHGSKGG